VQEQKELSSSKNGDAWKGDAWKGEGDYCFSKLPDHPSSLLSRYLLTIFFETCNQSMAFIFLLI